MAANPIVWVPCGALLLIASSALREVGLHVGKVQEAGAGPGANTIVIVQLALAASDVPQFEETRKSELLPELEVSEKPNSIGPPPVFCNVSVSGALAAPTAVFGKPIGFAVVRDNDGPFPALHLSRNTGLYAPGFTG
jgi:hypothetical protein